MQMGAPPLAVWAVWGMALFCLLWALAAVPRIAALPFGLPHWGMSFPLAAFAAFTLRLGALAPWAQVLGTALIAMASLVITLLAIKTLQGLARGTLLVPEVAPNPH
jgi:tellurite resistance protein